MSRPKRSIVTIPGLLLTGMTLIFAGVMSPAVAKKKDKEKESEKSFEELVGSAKKSEGFFTLHLADEKIYFELPSDIFEVDYGLSASVVGGVGDWRVRGSGLGANIVRFERLGEKIRLVKRNVNFRADPSSSIRHAVQATFPSSPILTAEVKTTNPQTKAVVADLADLFSAATYEVVSSKSGFKMRDGGRTVVGVFNNPENLTVRVAYHFERTGDKPGDDGEGSTFGGSGGIARLADPRHLEVTVQYDLFALPGNGFRPRPADDRLGVWEQTYKDYTGIEDRSTAFRYNAVRFRVDKSDPSKSVSPARKPITFYIDKAVPAKIRPLIREGVLWWDEAFQAVGLSGAIQVEDQPEDADWHPTDIRYNMIYWNLSDDLNFSGLAGPMLVSPLTGEILKANAYLNAEFLSFARQRYLVYTWWRGPAVGEWETPGRSAFDGMGDRRSPWWQTAEARADGRRQRATLCDYDASFSSQLAFARLVLHSRGLLVPGSPEEDRYAREAFHELVAHEIGHAIGFGHNFKASRLTSYDAILSGAAGGAISGSIMDYNPINLPPRGEKPGPFFLTELGEYDRFAVEYLYKPFDHLTPDQEVEALETIAVRAEVEPGLIFDDGTLSGSDPTSSTDDLGDDPLRFADDRLAMVAEILPKLPDLVLDEGHDYNLIRQALDAAVISVSMDYFDLAARYLGGREILRVHHRAKARGESTRPVMPIRPIPAATQEAALDLITKRLFADKAYVVGPRFLNQLQADLLLDWNYPQHYAKDYDYESRLAWLYGTTLATVLDPGRLARVKDNEGRYAKGEKVFTLPDLFERLTTSVFSGLEQGNVSTSSDRAPLVASKRRALHRIYVGLLSDLVLAPAKGTPSDASALAASQLRKIQERAKKAQTTPAVRGLLDGYGHAHLGDLQTRIGRVLDAQIDLPAKERS